MPSNPPSRDVASDTPTDAELFDRALRVLHSLHREDCICVFCERLAAQSPPLLPVARDEDTMKAIRERMQSEFHGAQRGETMCFEAHLDAALWAAKRDLCWLLRHDDRDAARYRALRPYLQGCVEWSALRGEHVLRIGPRLLSTGCTESGWTGELIDAAADYAARVARASRSVSPEGSDQ